MKRRQFTQTLALLAGGLAASAYAGIPVSHKLLRIGAVREKFSRDQFDSHIGSAFRLDDAPNSLVLKGIENANFDCPCEQFNLVFELSSGSQLEEGIHRLESPDGSRMELFLIPSERGTQTQQLVSIFNLLPVA